MAKKLGKIEKPTAKQFESGRKLYFVPLIYCGVDPPADFHEIYRKYWKQVEQHISDLELKLGNIDRIYHELIPEGGNSGCEAIKELNQESYQIIKPRLDKGARLEVLETIELLTEFMDWGKCLAVGLQNQQVFTTVYESYNQASKKRNQYLSEQIDTTLKTDETAILIMREGHQVQFPSDIQIFYISPPALDEIKRWLRDQK